MLKRVMKLYVDTHAYVEDLKATIVVNATGRQFLTSDDPAVFTSRFHLQKLRSNVFGIASSGVLFLLPLTPRHLLLCWDANCYSITNRRDHFVTVDREDDVSAFNSLQYLRAASTVYFRSWDDRDWIAQEFGSLASRRLSRWAASAVLVPKGLADGEVYRRATPIEARTSKDRLIVTRNIHPAPLSWPSLLKWRYKIKTHHDGSAMGHIRPGHPALTRIRQ
jgi:hypothetical protein